jgi:hypothetical protein
MKQSGGMNPALFARGQDGKRPADVLLQQAQTALQNNSLDGFPELATAILPHINGAVGAKLQNGNTVTGVGVTHILPSDDPGQVHITTAMQHEDDQGGNQGIAQTPHFSDDQKIPVTAIRDGLQRFIDTAKMTDDPRVQKALQSSVRNGDSDLHDYLELGRRFGAGPIPKVYKEIPAGGSLADVTPGTAPTIVAQGQDRLPAGVLGEAVRLQNEDKAKGQDQGLQYYIDAANESFQNRKAPPDPMVNEARQARIDSEKQRAQEQAQKNADLAHRGAVLQLAKERGYTVDAQGNVKYGKADPTNKINKGDAVNDPDFDQQVADMRQAADEAAAAGKPLPTSKLVQMVKDKAKAAAIDGPDKPKGVVWISKDGKTKRISLGGGKWRNATN